MQLLFRYPSSPEPSEITIATRVYKDIWQSDSKNIIERFENYTGLHFQQEKIEVLIHDGQSMSGMDGVPMRLNVNIDTIIKKRSALLHELAHRLLFGNGLYAPDEASLVDNDEIRVLLFQGDVLRDLYGESDYSFWADLDPNLHTDDHLKDLRSVLYLSRAERSATIRRIVSVQMKSQEKADC